VTASPIQNDLHQRAWRIKAWCAALSISRPYYYILRRRDPDLIEEVKVGGATLVLTPPVDYVRAQAARRAAEEAEAAADASRPPGRPRKNLRLEDKRDSCGVTVQPRLETNTGTE
jgi:hypothetical protein